MPDSFADRPEMWLDRAQDGTWSVMKLDGNGYEEVVYISGRDQDRALADLKTVAQAADRAKRSPQQS